MADAIVQWGRGNIMAENEKEMQEFVGFLF